MSYSPECVEAFEVEFPDSHSGLYWNQDKNSFFWVGGEHDDSFMHRMATERMAMLEGYAANWERVRALEEGLANLCDAVLDPDDSYEICQMLARQNRKLLEAE